MFCRLETDSSDSYFAGLLQIFFPIVYEQGFLRLDSERLDASLVDFWLWFDAAGFGGKDLMVEMFDPREVFSYVDDHVGWHVG